MPGGSRVPLTPARCRLRLPEVPNSNSKLPPKKSHIYERLAFRHSRCGSAGAVRDFSDTAILIWDTAPPPNHPPPHPPRGAGGAWAAEPSRPSPARLRAPPRLDLLTCRARAPAPNAAETRGEPPRHAKASFRGASLPTARDLP